ncbi:hypothetical protein D3C85_1551790 [compost metagenome]
MKALMSAVNTDPTDRQNVWICTAYTGRICWTGGLHTAATALKKSWKLNVKNRLHAARLRVIPASTGI